MRILTFTSLFPNSTTQMLGIFIYQRMRHVNARGNCMVEVVAPVPWSSRLLPREAWRTLTTIASREDMGGLTIYHPRYLMLPKVGLLIQGISMFLFSYPLVRRLHERENYDCIDAHYVYPDGFAAVLLGKLLGLPVIVSARGSDMTLYPSFRLIAPLIRYTLQQADGLVAVSAALAKVMIEQGASREKTAVIGNGVDSRRFFPIPPSAARKHLGLPPDAKVVLAVGGLREVKGQAHIVRAVAKIIHHFPDLRCFIIGEGELRGGLERLITDLRLAARVELVGEKSNEELRYWFSAASVSCLASSREGWPNVVLESMACGTPVVATRVGGTPEVIASPNLGTLVDGNAESLAAGLEAALRRNWDREAIAAFALTRTWEVVAAEVEEFTRSILKRKTATA